MKSILIIFYTLFLFLSSSVTFGESLGKKPDSKICDRAEDGGSWENRIIYLDYVTEAKRRGLTCGIIAKGTPRYNNKEAL